MPNPPERYDSGCLITGIVPVHMYESLEFQMPWDDTLMPIAPNYTALQNAVYNCVRVGCDSIWVVVSDHTKPLVRSILGNAWKDCIKSQLVHNRQNYRLIPIYYVPITVWDRDERDSHGWSALHGCYISRKLASFVSHWIRPRKYFISWPLGVYPLPKNTRSQIREYKRDIILTHQDESVKNGKYLGFTISWEEAHRLRRRVWHNSTLRKDWFGNDLPKEEQNNARWFKLEDIFFFFNTEGYTEIEVDDYYSIDTWENYKNCLLNADFIERPDDDILKYREFRGIDTYDEIED